MKDEQRLEEIERKHKEAETRLCGLVPNYESALSADMKWLIKELREAREVLKPFAEAAMHTASVPDNAYLWLPTSTNKRLPGISKSDVLKARDYLEGE